MIASQHELKHPALITTLTDIARHDENMFAAGLALDALTRILGADDPALAPLLREMPTLCWPSLVRGGLAYPLLEE